MHAIRAAERDDLTRAVARPLVAAAAISQSQVEKPRHESPQASAAARDWLERAFKEPTSSSLPQIHPQPFPFSHPRITPDWGGAAWACSGAVQPPQSPGARPWLLQALAPRGGQSASPRSFLTPRIPNVRNECHTFMSVFLPRDKNCHVLDQCSGLQGGGILGVVDQYAATGWRSGPYQLAFLAATDPEVVQWIGMNPRSPSRLTRSRECYPCRMTVRAPNRRLRPQKLARAPAFSPRRSRCSTGTGRPLLEQVPASLVPEKGWHFLHLFYRVDRVRLAVLTPEDRQRGVEDFRRVLAAKTPGAPEQIQCFAVPGHQGRLRSRHGRG